MRRGGAAGTCWGVLGRLAIRIGKALGVNEDKGKPGKTEVDGEDEDESKESNDGTRWAVCCCLPDRVREALDAACVGGTASGFKNDSKSLS